MSSQSTESESIAEVIDNSFPRLLDGKEVIIEMRRKGSRNWKQMEWFGFHAEEEVRELLIEEIGGREGPKYGKTTFDYAREGVWDVKTHPRNKKNGGVKLWLPLNDSEAIHSAVEEWGSIGFIILSGEAEYDSDGEFREWHEREKGGESSYTKKRKLEGRKSRVRKTSIKYDELHLVVIDNDDIERGMRDGWLKGFQLGMRNSNGTPRRVKMQIKIGDVPRGCISVTRAL